jgi:hypothetical protein
VVVAVGLTLVEPLANAEVNVPGVMARLVAPVVTQLSVLPAPEAIVAGLAVNEVITGTERLPSGENCEVAIEPQPASPTTAKSVSTASSSVKEFSH